MWFLTIRLVEAKPKQRNLAERNWGDLDLSLCSEMCTAAILQHDIIIIKNTHNSGIDWHQLPIWTISNIPVVTAVVFFLKAKHAKVKQLQRVLYPGIFPFISLAVSQWGVIVTLVGDIFCWYTNRVKAWHVYISSNGKDSQSFFTRIPSLGYVELADFHEIWPEDFLSIEKQKSWIFLLWLAWKQQGSANYSILKNITNKNIAKPRYLVREHLCLRLIHD